ncbi:ClpXP protease specificity-enhancing factor [Psychrosphaera algicola]|uniref:ClpXP protease specificity-enhancing factor n=1 Tax=Psychrosphaera algicola TaxID=3023714 RepID=A0ABT5FH43_9GAMM|nr:ClpXP protease specificity-enhancing factor [Psychrosphaera sp. G1-22]MDC2890509.1 ClpXP protease specificity-enhancing factor [Psychrosphaera sp. G1-22]
MTSNRPYLLRAFYDWILDNDCTPYIVVEADLPHVSVPPQTVKDGQVVLNVSPDAVNALNMDKTQLTFSARFGGVPHDVYIPMYAISAIYAKENGAGTMFPPEDLPDDLEQDLDGDPLTTPSAVTEVESAGKAADEPKKQKPKVSHLSLVKK